MKTVKDLKALNELKEMLGGNKKGYYLAKVKDFEWYLKKGNRYVEDFYDVVVAKDTKGENFVVYVNEE